MSDTNRDDDPRRPIRRPLVASLPLALIAAAWPYPAALAQAGQAGSAGSYGPLSASLPAAGSQRFRVYYGDVSRNVQVAEIDYRLAHDADAYQIDTRGNAVGMVAMFYSGVLIQNSIGRIGKNGLLPEKYSERRGKRPERVIRFDQAGRKMIGLGDPPEVVLLPGTQDRLSVFYQVGLLARSRPAMFQAGQRFNLPLASMKEIDIPDFLVAGAEAVQTARGSLPALRLTVRNPADSEDPTIDVWLGSTISMLPARIRVQDPDGKVIDQVLVPSA